MDAANARQSVAETTMFDASRLAKSGRMHANARECPRMPAPRLGECTPDGAPWLACFQGKNEADGRKFALMPHAFKPMRLKL